MILAGIFQIILGLSGVAKLMRFIPRSVMVGFVNALAILIFLSQVPELLGVPVAGVPPHRAGPGHRLRTAES